MSLDDKRMIGVFTFVFSTCLFVASAHAFISNGASAIDALGQLDDSIVDPQPVFTKSAANNGPNKYGISADGGSGTLALDAVNHRLFIADTANNRIVVHDLTSGDALIDGIPDHVLGQSVFYTDTAATTASGFRRPSALAIDADDSLLFVADMGNNRVLVFNIAAVSTGESATHVLGQSSFTASGASTARNALRTPGGMNFDDLNDRLFIADTANNRVLVFTGSIATGMDAGLVLGQSSFTASGAATTRSGLSRPSGVAYGSGSLYIADRENNRLLLYTGSVLATGMNANKVLGQTSFTASTAGTTQSTLRRPTGVAYGSGSLYIADSGNNRVLVHTGAIVNGKNAGRVLGKTTFTVSTAQVTQALMNGPAAAVYDAVNRRLFTYETRNHRVLVFDVATVTTGENAIDGLAQFDDDLVDPQPIYTKSTANNGPNKLGIQSSTQVQGLVLDEVHHRLFVPERDNNRVLVYDLDANNELVDRIPDHVLGQDNYYSKATANTQDGFNLPGGITYDPVNDRLFVSQASNRISVFDTATITDGMDAAYVLGQTNFATVTPGTSRTKLNGPTGMAYDDVRDRLFVADSTSQRIVMYIFTGGVISNGLSGSNVFGQSTFSTAVATTSQSGMRRPFGVAYDSAGDRLFVVDSDNSRILSFELSAGVTDGMNASNVLGWSNFTSSGFLAASIDTISFPTVAEYDRNNDRLFVGQGHRILGYDVSSMVDGQRPTVVLGQPDFDTNVAATAINRMSLVNGLAYDHTNDRLFAMERGNSRVMLFDAEPAPVSSSSSSSSAVSSSSSSRVTGGGGHRNTQDAVDRATVHRDEPAESDSPAGGDDASSGSAAESFSDIPARSWFAAAIDTVVDRNIFSGYETADGTPTGEFGPMDPITIGQLLKVALLTADHVLPIPAGIPDNPTATDWSVPYVALAESLNLTQASADVHKNATRGEVIATLLEASGIRFDSDPHNDFSDLDPSNPHAAAILTAAKLGLVTGDTDEEGNRVGTVRPDDDINRAEVAVLIVRFLERSEN